MPIDKKPDEFFIPVRLAAKYFPPSSQTSRPRHVSAIYRYISKGLLAADGVTRVYLHAQKRGSCVCVTLSAIERFLAATAGEPFPADDTATAPSDEMTNRDRRRRARQVEAALDEAGI